ncbi:MAG: SulP family inorganic anion transporter [Chloroflexi bacterium]|nr:SulP family inorganic anion transporter [Chloroflexota bacterium]MBK7915382.1 SulP family inorganic anion transporter [Chloroflexota bacterium]MBK8934128.1 SulP family inorganic anion transporter [Chloroflexota bacterium]MBP6803586.1 SulP family inorganic anion transporter [Chloroflexota bacterium]MBP7592103.1 SulP family inorganic anion transporter [Chloroflexota bacterium]
MRRQFINRNTIGEDLTAGLVLGIQSIPDGLANGLLALINPIYGLYGYMMGTFSGAFFTSSAFMSIQATSAMALVVASVPQVTAGPTPNTPLFALAILTGVFMLIAGLLKLGSLVRFVPNAVMTGFVNAVAFLIILGQLDDFTRYSSVGANRIARTLDLLRNLDQVHLPTLMVGILTIVLILTLEKTSLKSLGIVVAMVVASLVVPLLGADGVVLVRDVANIPSSLPRPLMPPLSVFPGLIIPALALTFVGLMQGAGITQSIPNPDGRYPDASGDFIGQGVANMVSGLFQGTAVGGSLSATALVVGAGARSRFANISAGVVMALAIVLFGRYVGAIAMPVLAGLLIVVGFRTLKPAQIRMVWRTGAVQQGVMSLTFLAALFIPLQYAVLLGVALAVLLYVFQQSNKLVVKAWEIGPGEYPVESDPPTAVPPHQVTILMPYGSLFYAAAPVFSAQLPEVTHATQHAVVILTLRGQTDVGSTFLKVLTRYANQLHEQDSKLMLAGIEPYALIQIERTGILRTIGRENVFPASEGVGMALLQAVEAAETWIAAQPGAIP